jgi:phosphoglycolate phosphatase
MSAGCDPDERRLSENPSEMTGIGQSGDPLRSEAPPGGCGGLLFAPRSADPFTWTSLGVGVSDILTRWGVSVRLAVLDLVGTAVADDGLALDAVRRGLVSVGVPVAGPRVPALERQARAAMDRPVPRIFADLLDGDQRRARLAAEVYEAWLCDEAAAGRVVAAAGAAAAIVALREADVAVAVVGNLSTRTCDRLVAATGLPADVVLGPDDAAGRGLPEPDLVLAAARAADVDPADVVVAADTTSAMVAAVRAGAGLALGVLGGAHPAHTLRAAGAHDVLGALAELPARLGLPQFRFPEPRPSQERSPAQDSSASLGGSGAVIP